MVDTTNKAIAEPVQGATSWGDTLNANFTIIDNAFGGNSSISVTGVTTTQTLTSAQYQNLILTFSGTLSANLIYQVPAGVSGRWIIANNTIGLYTLTISTDIIASASVITTQGYGTVVYSEGTNVYQLGVTLGTTTGTVVFGGGYTVTNSSVMDYINITNISNAATFGNLTIARRYLAGVNSSTRGVFGGGYTTASSAVMDYITIATAGDATTFGNLTVARNYLAGVSSATRGVFGGGTSSAVMDYITIATTGNATSFGNLTVARDGLAGVNSSTRGVFGGGYTSSASAVMDYITIATTGNATTFGNLTLTIDSLAGVSSGTRGVFGGGLNTSTVLSTMEYITIATTGNTTSFGNLTVTRYSLAGVSSYVPS